MTLDYLTAADITASLKFEDAIRLLETALSTGTNPESDSPRLFSPASDGEFLMMPAAGERYCGVKVATIAPGNPSAGLPKIQGVYLLFDSCTLAPVASMDGAELTLLRTPATTAMAVQRMLAADPRGGEYALPQPHVGVLLIFGTGPQAWRHIQAISSVCKPAEIVVVGRRQDKTDALLDRCAMAGWNARRGTSADVSDADIVVCASSATEPLFNGDSVAPHAVVAAIGSHGLEAREIDQTLAKRADVVVEGRASALREAGDLIPARSVDEWQLNPPVNLAELVQGKFLRNPDRPALYTGVGMAWQDVTVAAGIYDAWLNMRAAP